MLVRILTAVTTVAILAAQIAQAKDWLYCIAPSHAERKLYMSPVFPTDGPTGSAESAFAASLSQSYFHFDDVQCPRSDDEASAMSMQRHTIDFNQEVGNTIVNLRWRAR